MSFNLNRRKLLKYFTFPAVALAFMPEISAAAGHGEPKQPQLGNYVLQTQITGTIISGTRSVGIMQADVVIYTVDNNLKQRLVSLKPVIISKWRAALQFYSSKYYVAGTVPDANMVAGLLQRAISEELRGSRARVLIMAIIAR